MGSGWWPQILTLSCTQHPRSSYGTLTEKTSSSHFHLFFYIFPKPWHVCSKYCGIFKRSVKHQNLFLCVSYLAHYRYAVNTYCLIYLPSVYSQDWDIWFYWSNCLWCLLHFCQTMPYWSEVSGNRPPPHIPLTVLPGCLFRQWETQRQRNSELHIPEGYTKQSNSYFFLRANSELWIKALANTLWSFGMWPPKSHRHGGRSGLVQHLWDAGWTTGGVCCIK